jgi:hypothetical protein
MDEEIKPEDMPVEEATEGEAEATPEMPAEETDEAAA